MEKLQSDDAKRRVTELLGQLDTAPENLLIVLHAIQDQIGYVPEESVPVIASALNLSRAEVHGVITFYHHYRTTPPGRHKLEVCCAEACQARGVNELLTHLKQKLGIDFHQTTSDGSISLEPVYCLGNCALGPSLLMDGKIHGRVTQDSLEHILQSKVAE